MRGHQSITLRRDCEAVQVPSGTPLTLLAGTKVTVTQSLGGTYTVTTDHGQMVRIAGKDADALGLGVEANLNRGGQGAGPDQAPASAEDAQKLVWEQLRTCYDPEIPVNIVELGLVYHCDVKELPSGGYRANVKFTLTAPGCGMGPVLKADAESKLAAIPGMKEVNVEVVFDPPWNPSMMTEAARLELGML